MATLGSDRKHPSSFSEKPLSPIESDRIKTRKPFVGGFGKPPAPFAGVIFSALPDDELDSAIEEDTAEWFVIGGFDGVTGPGVTLGMTAKALGAGSCGPEAAAEGINDGEFFSGWIVWAERLMSSLPWCSTTVGWTFAYDVLAFSRTLSIIDAIFFSRLSTISGFHAGVDL